MWEQVKGLLLKQVKGLQRSDLDHVARQLGLEEETQKHRRD